MLVNPIRFERILCHTMRNNIKIRQGHLGNSFRLLSNSTDIFLGLLLEPAIDTFAVYLISITIVFFLFFFFYAETVEKLLPFGFP